MSGPLTASVPSPWRWPVAASLAVNAAIHVELAPMHLAEAPYVGVLFLALSLVCVILASALLLVDHAWVWTASGLVSLLALSAFLASRTVGLPQITDEIGNWADPLGRLTVVVEALAVLVCALVLHAASLRGSGSGTPLRFTGKTTAPVHH